MASRIKLLLLRGEVQAALEVYNDGPPSYSDRGRSIFSAYLAGDFRSAADELARPLPLEDSPPVLPFLRGLSYHEDAAILYHRIGETELSRSLANSLVAARSDTLESRQRVGDTLSIANAKINLTRHLLVAGDLRALKNWMSSWKPFEDWTICPTSPTCGALPSYSRCSARTGRRSVTSPAAWKRLMEGAPPHSSALIRGGTIWRSTHGS